MIRAALRRPRAAIAAAARRVSAPSASTLQGKWPVRGCGASTGCGSGSRTHAVVDGGATGCDRAGRGGAKGAGVAGSGAVTVGSCPCVLSAGQVSGSRGADSGTGTSGGAGSAVAGVGRSATGRGSLRATGSAVRAGEPDLGVVGARWGGIGWTTGAGGTLGNGTGTGTGTASGGGA